MAKSIFRAGRSVGATLVFFGLSMVVQTTVGVGAGIGVDLRRSFALERRAVQSAATCLDEFSWMDNSLKQSPCIVTAYLLSACAGGSWNVSQVTANTHYTPPSTANANGCSCSWAVYNTLQACADCQGQNFQSAMLSWSGYNVNCTGTLLSTSEYYPADTPIPDETAIPFWATTNPSTWHDGLFDPSTAQSIANEDGTDVTQSSRTSNSGGGKKTNVGAIVGGVVGGVFFLLALGLVAFFLVRRRRVQRAGSGIAPMKTGRANVHFSSFFHTRSPSEMSAVQNYKYANANANDYAYHNNYTPSPGPTVPMPMSMENTGGSGTGTGRPPYIMHSSSSFTSATASPPPGEYVMHTQPGKGLGYPGTQMGTGMGMGMVTMNNNQSNPTVSSAYATATASAAARTSHAHTLSNDSAAAYSFSLGSSGGGGGGGVEPSSPPEGTIVPFVLPPTLPEPMGAEGQPGAGIGIGMGRSATPGASSKGGHGPNESAGSNELYTTAARKPARRNPPAYTFSPSPPPGLTPNPNIGDEGVGEEEGAGAGAEEGDGEGDGDGDAESVEAQREETTLSGTTLRQGSTAPPPTTLAGSGSRDGDGGGAGTRVEPGELGAALGRLRDRHGYPADRKV